MLLLPHCLKHAEGCPADYDEFGLDCRQCGACSIADFRGRADAQVVAVARGDLAKGLAKRLKGDEK